MLCIPWGSYHPGPEIWGCQHARARMATLTRTLATLPTFFLAAPLLFIRQLFMLSTETHHYYYCLRLLAISLVSCSSSRQGNPWRHEKIWVRAEMTWATIMQDFVYSSRLGFYRMQKPSYQGLLLLVKVTWIRYYRKHYSSDPHCLKIPSKSLIFWQYKDDSIFDYLVKLTIFFGTQIQMIEFAVLFLARRFKWDIFFWLSNTVANIIVNFILFHEYGQLYVAISDAEIQIG